MTLSLSSTLFPVDWPASRGAFLLCAGRNVSHVPMTVSHEPELGQQDVQHRADLVPAEVADLGCP
jgi:hypothetical protein